MKFIEPKKKIKKEDINIVLSPFLIIYGILLIIVLLPITIVFLTLDVLVDLLNGINQAVTQLYRRMLDKYHPLVLQTVRVVIVSQKRYSNLNEEEVLQKVKESQVPFLPIIGVILLTISFVMQIS